MKLEAQILVTKSQLSHARLGLSVAADNTAVAGEWLEVIKGLERRLEKLEAQQVGMEAEAA
jgi:hypothetical protein